MKKNWWKKAVVYQVYPRSFYDSNEDGMGDLKGITKKLDYIKALGVNALWLCPVYQSPMDDNGYDISDYYHIDPSFGTDEDMDELIYEANKRGINIIMDMVINHCSDEHEWFQKAKKNPEGKYGKYFFIKKGKNGNPPNNWRSIFGGSAWEAIEGTPYYYLHLFTKKQVDFNWENQELREEIYKMMNWWLDKGIAGFRMDAITYIKKAEGLPSFESDGEDGMVSVSYGSLNQKGIGNFLTELRDRTYGKRNAMTVGETAGVPDEEVVDFISQENGYFSMIFDFSYCQLNLFEPNYYWYETRKWTPEDVKREMFHSHGLAGEKGWLGVCLENHDQPRCIDHYLYPDGRNYYGASMLAVMQMMLRGTPYIYQGQELGMRNCRFASIEEYDDCSTKNQYAGARKEGYSHKEAMEFMFDMSRDNARTPFQWNKSENAGFSIKTPWLKVNENYHEVNAEKQMKEQGSIWNWYKELIELRISSEYTEILTEGSMCPIMEEQKNLLAYKRVWQDKEVVVLCNYQGEEQKAQLSNKWKKVIKDNYGKVISEEKETLLLRPYEAVILEM
nr:alpha-glucosidase [uncultured Blautia sp.]